MAFTVHRRNGFYSIRKVAREMCRLILVFTPIIVKLYPSATQLHVALAAASAACEALVFALDEEAEQGV